MPGTPQRLMCKFILCFFSPLVFSIIFGLIIYSCKKEIEPVFPIVETKPVIISLANFAECGGIIGDEGNVDILSRGVLWGLSPDLNLLNAIGITTDGKGAGEYKSTLVHLELNTKYFVKAYAETKEKIIYGGIKDFIIRRGPAAYTDAATFISGYNAILNGLVTPNYDSTIAVFQFGVDTNYFATINIREFLLSGNIPYKISLKISDLKPNHTYHYRILAESRMGKSYGKDTSFTTKEVVYDIDKNSYSVTQIGEQTWMMENLRTSHYSNGDAIPNPVNSHFPILSPGYWMYENNEVNGSEFGNLYNGYAVCDYRNICPTGWHVPTIEDFRQLITFIGGSANGGKLKETDFIHWKSPNSGATNETGFTGRGGGLLAGNDGFQNLRNSGFWWSFFGNYSLELNYNKSDLTQTGLEYQEPGYSVRCIKGVVPWAKVNNATEIKTSSAILGAQVRPNNLPVEVYFEYGETNQYGISVPAEQNPISGTDQVIATAKLSGLKTGCNYYWRVKVIWPEGYTIIYPGWPGHFRTYQAPFARTGYATSISDISALIYAEVSANNSPTTIKIEYGPDLDYGFEKIVATNYTWQSGGNFNITANLIGLSPGNIYNYRVVATNPGGISYGENKTFRTANPIKVFDSEGNSYLTITIGIQTWIMTNLRTKRFLNGDAIPNLSNNTEWQNTLFPSWVNYLNSNFIETRSGLLYNFYAIEDERKICPAGWHIPDSTDWNELINYLNDPGKEGGYLVDPAIAAFCNYPELTSNSTSFSGNSTGFRASEGEFFSNCNTLTFWSSTFTENNGMYFRLTGPTLGAQKGYSKKNIGYPIRCLQDRK